jgi:hypothetical protein
MMEAVVNRLAGVVAVAALVVATGALAQNAQFPGVAPPVPAPGAAPPAIAPGPAAPSEMARPSPSRRSSLVQRRRGPPVEVPRGAGESFGDRATNCVHYGTAAGVRPGEIGQFTRDCVNN